MKPMDPEKKAAVADEKSQSEIKSAETAGQFSALGKMAMFPAFTFVCYLRLSFISNPRAATSRCIWIQSPLRNSRWCAVEFLPAPVLRITARIKNAGISFIVPKHTCN